ncbi:Coagulation factor V [Exaiptasia diaphana]|nr:Coagulation factor V [Exaiptasia diaphana]
MGMEDGRIKDAQITASSYAFSDRNTQHHPKYGRLHKRESATHIGAWASGDKKYDEYIQVDLGSVKVITMVATQGRPGCCLSWQRQWVTKYAVSYSDDAHAWKDYLTSDCIKVFPGNTNQDTVVTNKFEKPFNARHFRLIVKDFYDWPTLRMELYGCDRL